MPSLWRAYPIVKARAKAFGKRFAVRLPELPLNEIHLRPNRGGYVLSFVREPRKVLEIHDLLLIINAVSALRYFRSLRVLEVQPC